MTTLHLSSFPTLALPYGLEYTLLGSGNAVCVCTLLITHIYKHVVRYNRHNRHNPIQQRRDRTTKSSCKTYLHTVHSPSGSSRSRSCNSMIHPAAAAAFIQTYIHTYRKATDINTEETERSLFRSAPICISITKPKKKKDKRDRNSGGRTFLCLRRLTTQQ